MAVAVFVASSSESLPLPLLLSEPLDAPFAAPPPTPLKLLRSLLRTVGRNGRCWFSCWAVADGVVDMVAVARGQRQFYDNGCASVEPGVWRGDKEE